MILADWGLVLSTALVFAGLWQIEIITGWDPDDVYDFPFYWGRLNKWVARDLWYAIIIVGWLLGIVSGATM